MSDTIQTTLRPASIASGGNPAGEPIQWAFYPAAALLFAAVSVRSILIYGSTPHLSRVLGLLGLWFVLATVAQTRLTQSNRFWVMYVACQTYIVFELLTTPGFPDFFATLLSVLAMQVMMQAGVRVGGAWIVACALLLVAVLYRTYGAQAFALAVIYSAANVLFGSYALAARRARAASRENESLASRLEVANRELIEMATRKEQLVLASERSRLARDLHDSVAQTLFSISLASQSASLMLSRDAAGLAVQLSRIVNLSRSALAEMRALISELDSQKALPGGVVASLRRHAAERAHREGLAVSVESEGGEKRSPEEEEALFHIAQEALNNVVKHSGVRSAEIRVRLTEPFCLEVKDDGQGFSPQQSPGRMGTGLQSMSEQAAAIGWVLCVASVPGGGTRIRVEKRRQTEGDHGTT